VIIAVGTWVGLLAGVAAAGGGIAVADMTALSVQLACFGFVFGALALAGLTGRKAVAAAGAGAVAVLAFLVKGFAPLVDGLSWLKYLSPFNYHAGDDPLTNGIDVGGIVGLGLTTVVLLAVAVVGLRRRDLRG